MSRNNLKRTGFSLLLVFLAAMAGCDIWTIITGNGDGDGNNNNNNNEPTYFKVTASCSTGGVVTPSSAQVANVGGTGTKTFRAVTSDGYQFSKWTITEIEETEDGDIIEGESTENTTNPLSLTIDQDVKLYATFTSTGSNSSPVVYDISVTTTVDTPVNIQLRSSDADGDSVDLSLVDSPEHGTLSGSLPLITYTPEAGYAGPDSFTYKGNDGLTDSNTATVNISVIEAAAIGWAKSFGSSELDYVGDVTTDGSGNVYVTGTFSGTVDFDPGIPTVLVTSKGQQDMFLAKYSAIDSSLMWVQTIGGGQNDSAVGVVAATTGNVYLIGTFNGTISLSSSSGTAITLTSKGSADVLVAKYDPQGGHLWSRQIGGPGNDYGNAIALTPDENVILGGSFTQTVDFDPTAGTDPINSNGKSDGFVTKLSSTGEYNWTLRFGGTEEDDITGVACDQTHNILVTGTFFDSIALDPATGGEIRNSNGESDVFLVKVLQDGGFVWGKTIGGPGNEMVTCLALNDLGNAYIGGSFEETVDFNPDAGSDTHTAAGSTSGFVTTVGSTGSYRWTHTTSGTGEERVHGLALDSVSNVYAAGSFSGTTDFNPDGAADEKVPTGSADAFLMKLTTSVDHYAYTITTGGPSDDFAKAVTTVENPWLVYWGGGFQDTADLDPRSSSEMHTSFGNYDCFLIKMTATGSW